VICREEDHTTAAKGRLPHDTQSGIWQSLEIMCCADDMAESDIGQNKLLVLPRRIFSAEITIETRAGTGFVQAEHTF